eukprot:448430-Alexandrium_andersonii.AAC.1
MKKLLEPLRWGYRPPDAPDWRLWRARGASRGEVRGVVALPERPLAPGAQVGCVSGGAAAPPGEAPAAFLLSLQKMVRSARKGALF